MSQPRRNPAAKPIFNAHAVAARLAALKAAAESEEARWWTPALKFEWVQPRKGNNGTQWTSVSYTDENGVSGRLVVRINGERHSGQIMPSTDAGLAELTLKVKNPKVALKKRDKKPSVQVQKWSAQVKTAEDGISPLYDDDGQALLPGDDKLSPYYQASAFISEAFVAEASERVERGAALVMKAAELKRTDKQVTAQAVLEAFNAAQGSRRPGDIVLSTENVANLRKVFPAPKDLDLLTKGATVTSNVKIAALVQEYISSQAPRNAGMQLPNPMTRFAMNFDATTGVSQMAFYDKDQPYTEEGRQRYEVGRVEGDPVNADNIHKFVVSRSTLDGIVNMDSVCFSNMGISMPVKAEILVVAKPGDKDVDLDDVYDDEGCAYTPTDPVPAAGAPAATGSAPAAPARGALPAAAADQDENYDDLLADLSGAVDTRS